MIQKSEIETQILDSYQKLGYKPRGNQASIVHDILDAFLNKKKRNVVLGAGTGTGKSIIGAVVSDALSVLTADDNDLSSIISMGTNVLSTQYYETFSDLSASKVFQIKGSANYPCFFLKMQPSSVSCTADDCVKSSISQQEIDKFCNGCEYDSAKKQINNTEILITNYSYFLISQLTTGHLEPRKLHVFDEAHLLNDIFCNYTEIIVSVDLLDKYIKELSDTNGKCDNEMAGLVMVKERVSSGNVAENNYMAIIDVLGKIYKSAASILNSQATLIKDTDIVQSAKYSKLGKKFAGLGLKIKDMVDNEYDHVFDATTPNTFTIKTIFVGKTMDKLLANYNLFMSATITEQFVFDTLSLQHSETEFIEIPPAFPRENKPIFFLGKTALNYNSMKDPEVINELKNHIKTVVKFHENDKGLILVPSFYLGSQMAKSIVGKTKIFEHKSGMHLPSFVEEFKQYNGPAVLISPSIFEGLDFKDNESRYQIIVKAPWASLGDKRIKYISDNYPNLYAEMALLRLLQGVGRSIRTPEDYAVTYMLDPAIKKLFNSKMNIWKDHYLFKN